MDPLQRIPGLDAFACQHVIELLPAQAGPFQKVFQATDSRPRKMLKNLPDPAMFVFCKGSAQIQRRKFIVLKHAAAYFLEWHGCVHFHPTNPLSYW